LPTIGVSIAVPEPHGAALQAFRVSLGDLPAKHIPTHITLVPPAEVPEDAMRGIETHLQDAASRQQPFRVRLRGTGSFRPVSQVVFVQVSTGIAQCELLERAVRRDPIVREVEFPYHPHVTVGHDLADEYLDQAYHGLRDFVAQFRVQAFTLYAQAEDGTWRPQREFPLTGF